MSNREKYIAAFKNSLLVEDGELQNLKYQDIPSWDSVGHMALMATLEDVFGVELDIDDIIEFSSFEVGQQILAKYNVLI
jgi:acyl carrier protein